MKKITTLLTAGLFTVLSASAFACPKGTTLVGGTGPNHKGGKCVAANPTAQTASKASTTATKANTTKAVEAKPKDAKAAVKTETAATKAKAETATKVKTDAAAKAKADTVAKAATTKDKAVKTASTNPLKP
ncbi:hypothetical protein [Acinetobacter bereziniae]|uniref:hypothetical protein n=1 Tax=Acinetobacter bereziniae TaxID=106648 RepID=UPI00190010BC|nr:hypothetical protein [Acinetobacter bereziniae]MBJ8445848.1 hypothetical protein [Acinetobacter bereziniae]